MLSCCRHCQSGEEKREISVKPEQEEFISWRSLLVVELHQTKHCTYLTDDFISVWSKRPSPFASPDASTYITKAQFLGRCLSCAHRAGLSGRGASDHAALVTREARRARHAGHACWPQHLQTAPHHTQLGKPAPCIPTGKARASPVSSASLSASLPRTAARGALGSSEFLPGDEGFPHQWPQLISTGRPSVRTPKQGHGLKDKRAMLPRPHSEAGPARPAATLWLQPSNTDHRTQGSGSRSFWKDLEAKKFKTIQEYIGVDKIPYHM